MCDLHCNVVRMSCDKNLKSL